MQCGKVSREDIVLSNGCSRCVVVVFGDVMPVIRCPRKLCNSLDIVVRDVATGLDCYFLAS